MSIVASVSDDGKDIFEENNIKLMSYDQYYKMKRLRLLYIKNNIYYYQNVFNKSVIESDKPFLSMDEYKGHLIFVY
ncbi:lef-10 [Erannis ankeraria nucleopolyhedrovirus]|uniref:lef-10 n=1 Tax=Erannis ankeraria nucleopolyhedrovirus TaxID=2913600 RepID=UPI002481E9FD|nr:lef-10 [Erannis ankeraria nucleopolyhedrovirus]UJZ89050.1 lef-10 [Erannis ankeraria nucleopolyhedrovirus]